MKKYIVSEMVANTSDSDFCSLSMAKGFSTYEEAEKYALERAREYNPENGFEDPEVSRPKNKMVEGDIITVYFANGTAKIRIDEMAF